MEPQDIHGYLGWRQAGQVQVAASIGTAKNRMWSRLDCNIHQLTQRPRQRGQTVLAPVDTCEIWVCEWTCWGNLGDFLSGHNTTGEYVIQILVWVKLVKAPPLVSKCVGWF